METKCSAIFCMAFLLVHLSLLSKAATAQDNSCLNQLAPCLSYLNGTRDPPDSCCEPLKSVIQSDPQCLCSLASNRGTKQAEEAGIDINEAQKLPAKCGQRVNLLSCLSNSPASENSAQNSASSFVEVSRGVMVMTVLSVTAQMLWAST